MNKISVSILLATAVVFAVPGVGSAQYYYAEGPATRHDAGYSAPGASGSRNMPGYYTTPFYYSYAPPALSSPAFNVRQATTEEQQAWTTDNRGAHQG